MKKEIIFIFCITTIKRRVQKTWRVFGLIMYALEFFCLFRLIFRVCALPYVKNLRQGGCGNENS